MIAADDEDSDQDATITTEKRLVNSRWVASIKVPEVEKEMNAKGDSGQPATFTQLIRQRGVIGGHHRYDHHQGHDNRVTIPLLLGDGRKESSKAGQDANFGSIVMLMRFPLLCDEQRQI